MKKIWAFIISKPLTDVEQNQLLHDIQTFAESWTAHEQALSASLEVVGKRIIVLQVDEEITGASGCSIDKLTRFMKLTELKYGIELLNRMLVAYQKGDKIDVIHSSQIREALEKKLITEDTLVYNTAISSQIEQAEWLKPLKETWLNKYLKMA